MNHMIHIIFILLVVTYAFNLYNYRIKVYNLKARQKESVYDQWIDLQLDRKYYRVRGVKDYENFTFSSIKYNNKLPLRYFKRYL